jgi:hypothetical protein
MARGSDADDTEPLPTKLNFSRWIGFRLLGDENDLE